MPLVLALLLTQAPASQATALAKARRWNELLVEFEAQRPSSLSKKDRATIAKAFTAACEATEGDDPSLAQATGERAVALEPTAAALACAGAAAVHNRQPAAAEELLRRGLTSFPKDGRFPLELARLFYMEQDDAQALALVARIGSKSPQFAEATELKAKLVRRGGMRADAAPAGDAAPRRGGGPALTGGGVTGLGYESSVDGEGRRVRQNAFFRFRYFSGQRDFGQRAEYEGQVQESLEEARRGARRVLGVSREGALDVILYSREEFSLHFGGTWAAMIAGFYGDNAIRMNDSATLSDKTQRTLVHEYVHAVVDELAGFQRGAVPIWLNEGLAEYVEHEYAGEDGPAPQYVDALASRAQAGKLPSLAAMRSGALIAQANPVLAYAYAHLAVRLMVQRSSVPAVLKFIEALGRGAPFEKTFEQIVGKELSAFDEELRQSLGKH